MKIKLLIISILSLSCLASYADCHESSHKHRHRKHKHKHHHHHKHSSKREYHNHYYNNEPAFVCAPVVAPVVRQTVYTRPSYVECAPVVRYTEVCRPYERVVYRPCEPVCETVCRPIGPSFSINAAFY